MNEKSKTSIDVERRGVTLGYLFLTFLKIGAVSFGGNMALVSVVKNVLVDRDKVLKQDVLLDATAIASLLPGPMAVNIVAYLGFYFQKVAGAVISMIAILLPAVSAMLAISLLYFRMGWNHKTGTLLVYVTGAIAAIILTTALQFYEKEIKGQPKKILFCLLGLLVAVFGKSFGATIGILFLGGFAGWILQLHVRVSQGEAAMGMRWKPAKKQLIVVTILLTFLLLFLTGIYRSIPFVLLQLLVVFAGISLSLFGGGYVMIPIMQALFVKELAWLNQQEFADAIAFSQLTPGPILVSATFVGYKLAGWVGAIVATVAIFAPSAVLMLLLSKVHARFGSSPQIKNILAGVKAVVIGLIGGAGIKIGWQGEWNVWLAVFTVGSFMMAYRYKISPVLIILTCLLLSALLWYFNLI